MSSAAFGACYVPCQGRHSARIGTRAAAWCAPAPLRVWFRSLQPGAGTSKVLSERFVSYLSFQEVDHQHECFGACFTEVPTDETIKSSTFFDRRLIFLYISDTIPF